MCRQPASLGSIDRTAAEDGEVMVPIVVLNAQLEKVRDGRDTNTHFI